MANLKTVKKQQEMQTANLISQRLLMDHIKNMKGFSKMWTDGTESVKKDSLEKHIKGDPH